MKKLFLALALGLLLVAAVATLAQADNGPHGKFNGSTEACASCHRAHSAQSSDGFLLIYNDVYELCTSCHDGTGANTDVVDGVYDTSNTGPSDPKSIWPSNQGDPNHGLFGGGFVNTRMLTDFGNSITATLTTNVAPNINTSPTAWAITNRYDLNSVIPVARPATSHHNVEGGVGTVWGSGNINPSGTLANNWGAGTLTLECTSCHDPHGNAGRQGGLPTGAPVPSYRLLRFTPSGSNGYEVTGETGSGTSFTWNTDVVPSASGATIPDPAVKWYTVNNDISLDPSLAAYRGRAGSGEIYVAIFAGQGDYVGRVYGYKRPAAVKSTSGTKISCDYPPLTVPVASCGTPSGTLFDNSAPHDIMGYFCAQCHDRYAAEGGATRTTDSGDPGYHFRHRSVTNSATGSQYECVDCHNAHGTSSQASALASSAGYATGSKLLKGDNRAVCIRCHAGAVNFFNVTTSPNAPMVYP